MSISRFITIGSIEDVLAAPRCTQRTSEIETERRVVTHQCESDPTLDERVQLFEFRMCLIEEPARIRRVFGLAQVLYCSLFNGLMQCLVSS